MERIYRLHGHELVVEAESEIWSDAVEEILGAYRVPSIEGERPLRAHLGGSEDADAWPETITQRCHFGDLRFGSDAPEEEIWIDVHGRGRVTVHPEEGRMEARLAMDPAAEGWVVAHHAFYPGLLELLKARGLFPLHAGLVAREGRGALICGPSGSGKTTLSLALAHAGWSLLSDDTCFLVEDTEGPRALAFWEDLHVTAETVERFPDLHFLRGQAPRRANWKKHFGVHQLEGLTLSESCRPRWLLFPRVAGSTPTTVERAGGADSLALLTSQSVVPARPSRVGEHLSLLGAIARGVERFDVGMSDDLDEVLATLDSIWSD